MASYRQIHTKIWKDGWFLDLAPAEKLLFVYLFSNDRVNLLGLYDLPIKVICFETQMEQGTVEAGLARLEADGKVIYRDGWIWVKNLLRYNATNKDSPKIQAHIERTIEELPDIPLKGDMIAHYAPSIPYLYGMIPNRTEHEHETDTETKTEQEREQQQTCGANAADVLADVGMDQVDKVLQETRLTAEEIVATVAYAQEQGLGAGWIRGQLRDNTAHRPRAPDDGRRRYMEQKSTPICEKCYQHPCACEDV